MWPEDETKIAGRYQRSGHHLNTTTTDLKQIEMISFEKHELAQPSQKDCFGVAGSQFCMILGSSLRKPPGSASLRVLHRM